MRTRTDDAPPDIRETTCDACGTEGYTGQSGGDIHAWLCAAPPDHPPARLEVCEACLEDFERYEDYESPESDVLTLPQFRELLSHVNDERTTRGGERLPNPYPVPEAEQVEAAAREFTRIIRSYLGEEDWPALLEATRSILANEEPCCASHDYCDANIFMDQALRRITAQSSTPGDDRWDLAWDLAKQKNWFDA